MTQKADLSLEKLIESFDRRIRVLEQSQDIRNGNADGKTTSRAIYSDTFTFLLAENVTALVGLREAIISRNGYVRCIWLVLFLVGSGATIYYVVKSCMEYSSYPIANKITLMATDLFVFPSFKICTNSWIDPVKVAKTGLSSEAFLLSLGYLPSPDPNAVNYTKKVADEFELFYNRSNFSDPVDYYYSLAYDPILLDLDDANSNITVSTAITRMNDTLYLICDHCNKTFDVKKTYVSSFGVCYQFHLETATLQEMTTLRNRDNVLILMPNAAVLPYKRRFWTLFVETGEGTVTPSQFEGSTIQLNRSNMITVSRTVFQRLESKEPMCLKEGNTTPAVCNSRCLHDLVFNYISCHGLDYSGMTYPISSICNVYQNLQLQLDTPVLLYKYFDAIETFLGCQSSCLPLCTINVNEVIVQDIDMLLDKFEFPPDVTTAHLEIRDSGMQWGGILQYEETMTYSFDSLVGNVGGTLGLFLGATVFTFFQFILTLVEYFVGKHSRVNPSRLFVTQS